MKSVQQICEHLDGYRLCSTMMAGQHLLKGMAESVQGYVILYASCHIYSYHLMNIIPSMASLTMIIITVLPLLSGYQVAIRALYPQSQSP